MFTQGIVICNDDVFWVNLLVLKFPNLIELVSKQTLKLTRFSLHFSLHLLREILLICLSLKSAKDLTMIFIVNRKYLF